MQRAVSNDGASPGGGAAADRGSNSLSSSPEPPSRRRPKRNGAGGRKTQTTRKNGNGRNITLEDLRAHFRLSLGEAAQRLGVCASTLKRVCRRKGIPAWPQRKLVKLSRAVDQASGVADDQVFASHLASAYCTGYGDEGAADSEQRDADSFSAGQHDIRQHLPSGGFEHPPGMAGGGPAWGRFFAPQGGPDGREAHLSYASPLHDYNHSRLTASRSADLGHLDRMHAAAAASGLRYPAAPGGHGSHVRRGGSLFVSHDPVSGLRVPAAQAPAGLPPLSVRTGAPQGHRAGSPLRPGSRTFSVNTPLRYGTTGSAHSEHSVYPQHAGGAPASRFVATASHVGPHQHADEAPGASYMPNARFTHGLHGSLSLPELHVSTPHGPAPQGGRQDSSSEEAAFRTAALGASHFARIHPPGPANADRPPVVPPASGGAGGGAAGGNSDGAGAGALGAAAAHGFLGPHGVTADYASFSPRANGAFAGGVAGSLGGVGPGFSGHYGSPTGFGAPGYTSSGYHGMQLSAVCSDIARQLATWRRSPHPDGHQEEPAPNAAADASGAGGELAADMAADIAAVAAAAAVQVNHAANQQLQNSSGTDHSTQPPPDLVQSPGAMFGGCASPTAADLSHDTGLTATSGEVVWWAK